MKKFTNPLENTKIASPCKANWNEMLGNERKRYCSECKLNVYNLSDMTHREAESFLLNSEGRVCVKFYRRADGSVLTKDCPVGWQAFKKKVSRRAKAFASVCAGIFGGVFAFNQLQSNRETQVYDKNLMKVVEIDSTAPVNNVYDFEKNYVPLENPVFNEEPYGYMGWLDTPSEKDNKKIKKRKVNFKKIRKR